MPANPRAEPGSTLGATVPEQAVRTSKRRRPSGEPPPLPRQLNASGKWWLAIAGAAVAFLVVVATTRRTGVTLDVVDNWILQRIADLRSPALTRIAKVAGLLATANALRVLWLVNIVILVIWRRWRHLFVLLGAGLLVNSIVSAMAEVIQRPRPTGIEILGPWKGFAMPSLPLAMLAAFLVSTLYANVPAGRAREIGKLAVAGLVLLVTASRLYLAQDAPSDALIGIVIGVAVPLAAFRLFASNEVFPVSYHRGRTAHLDVTGARGEAIVRALHDQLGLVAIKVQPFGLEGSGGSTPLRVTIKGNPDTNIFCKLYSVIHVRSDRWYKLGRTLLYGRLEDEKAFNSVRRLVQYEDYLLRLLHAAQLPVPLPMGIVEITPDREYLLVMEFFEGAQEIGDAEIDDSIIDQGLTVVRRMWEAGLAHRDIKPANILVRDGQLLVIDSAFAEVRPSPWRQAVDLGNMMLVLALRTSAERVYERACSLFTEDEIAEAFSATRGLTMPTQLRRMMRQKGLDLHAEFSKLLPYRLPPIKIQRWSVRRVMLTMAVGIGGLIALSITIQLILGSPV